MPPTPCSEQTRAICPDIGTGRCKVTCRHDRQEYRAEEAFAELAAECRRYKRALEFAALKLDEIGRKALHWEKTFVADERSAARWRQIKDQAYACALEARLFSTAAERAARPEEPSCSEEPS